MVRLRIAKVREVCAKHPGMMNDFLKSSKVEAMHLLIARADLDRINSKYFGLGVGTILHRILEPVAAVPDMLLGTKLRKCGGCAERELRLNSAFKMK